MNRHQAREAAFQIIYQIDLGNNDPELSLQLRVEEVGLQGKSAGFCGELVRGVVAHWDDINQQVEAQTQDWHIDRMMSVDRNIIRLATYELLFRDDIPDKVAINEAVELAKAFGDDESKKFVNSVLDRVLKSKQ